MGIVFSGLLHHNGVAGEDTAEGLTGRNCVQGCCTQETGSAFGMVVYYSKVKSFTQRCENI